MAAPNFHPRGMLSNAAITACAAASTTPFNVRTTLVTRAPNPSPGRLACQLSPWRLRAFASSRTMD
jgi:hypothetical protein